MADDRDETPGPTPEPEPMTESSAGALAHGLPPEPVEDHADPERRPVTEIKKPSTVGGVIYLCVLGAAVAGIVIAATGPWRTGVSWLAFALLAAAGARLVLPDHDAGMLRVREQGPRRRDPHRDGRRDPVPRRHHPRPARLSAAFEQPSGAGCLTPAYAAAQHPPIGHKRHPPGRKTCRWGPNGMLSRPGGWQIELRSDRAP